MSDLKTSLREIFGFESFREGQEQTIQQLLQGQSSLAIFPTGSGKSLCYQLAALHLPKLTLVVSPLLALIKDQVDFLHSKGIAAASIDSTQGFEAQRQTIDGIRRGEIKILMVSVERFKNERFRSFIESIELSLLVVDEAHCISEWGHNFRPDYLKLPAYQKELNIPMVLLLTATATRKVKEDMCKKFAIAQNHMVQTGFYRSNLDLAVVPTSQSHKLARLLESVQGNSGAGIVYVTLQHTANEVGQYLREQGINAVSYHAGLPTEARLRIQDQFMQSEDQTVVATIAFGMGVDKANIRYVIHYDLPKSIENYSQEIGRAGRDGQASKCITLANLDGLNTVENFVYGDTPELTGIEKVIQIIQAETHGDQWEMQINTLSSSSNIRQLPLKTLLVHLEMQGVIQAKFSYYADLRYKFLVNEADILARFQGERKSFLQAVFQTGSKKRIWCEPNFKQLKQAYGAERGRAVTALEYLHENAWINLESKKITDVYQVNVARASEAHLASDLSEYFLSKEKSEIQRIANLVKFFEGEACLSKALAQHFDDAQVTSNCGHCSVCRGEIAKLRYSQKVSSPSLEDLKEFLPQLQQK
ncbi:RecQ family ATP-dependent DNA helicase [Lentisphaera profundi]|uniref:ATP-dependent DNA helicase RecQ n=1 Tax=Lentisphaera profundi TaxID=1658616 RepID=A0ABY7VTI5_9BACT|nr:RecQ family ATP-dependent DNA helicase [Lentisphaera profundi]WDE96069.1 RecQ family ATP-dependent DNA helicase [Lentisphaera profundi]